jgi:hypothetical protein
MHVNCHEVLAIGARPSIFGTYHEMAFLGRFGNNAEGSLEETRWELCLRAIPPLVGNIGELNASGSHKARRVL